MQAPRKLIGILLISSLCALTSAAQSLADAARQQQTAKKSSSSAPKHVITNEDLGSSSKSDDSGAKPATQKVAAATSSDAASPALAAEDHPSAEQVQDQVKAERQKIAQLEAQTSELQKQLDVWKTSDCTHYLRPDNSNTCDIPQKLTAELDRTKSQLAQEKKNLETIQDDARKMGFANSVYDPN